MTMVNVPEGLRLSRWYGAEPAVFLVIAAKAVALCEHAGFRKLLPSRAAWLLDSLNPKGCSQVRAFVVSARRSGLPVWTLDDPAVFALVRSQIQAGALVAVQHDGAQPAQTPSESLVQRRLVREIDGLARGRLGVAGRSYKLVADVDLARFPQRNQYEVVRHDDAVEVLARLAAQSGGGTLQQLLGQASTRLTRDWRPSLGEPEGLVLLRRIPVVAAAAVEAPAITPSQMAKLASARTATLEVRVFGLDDKPLAGLSYVIDAPDAERVEGDLGAGASTTVTSTKHGNAAVALKRSDGSVRA
jgi:hypothetical protein